MKNTMSTWYENQFKNLIKCSGFQTVYRVSQMWYIQGGANVIYTGWRKCDTYRVAQKWHETLCVTADKPCQATFAPLCIMAPLTHKNVLHRTAVPFLHFASMHVCCRTSVYVNHCFSMWVRELVFRTVISCPNPCGNTSQNRTPTPVENHRHGQAMWQNVEFH
jgi:hypothetical protein